MDSADAKHWLQEHPGSSKSGTDAIGRHQHKPKAHHYTGAGDLHSGGGSAFSVDLGEFNLALAQLVSQCEAFAEKVNSAADLATDLPDGGGPVAQIVGHAFNHRLGPDGGVHYAVRTNLDQLTNILEGLRATATSYQQAEAETTRILTQSGETA